MQIEHVTFNLHNLFAPISAKNTLFAPIYFRFRPFSAESLCCLHIPKHPFYGI
jgi:hypothetical protein